MSDTKALFKHSCNYLFSNIATKALAFVSIPVYTRILSVEDYGVVNVFLSSVGITSVLLTLNSEVAISRYYYEAKNEDDFKSFVGTSVFLASLIFVVTSFVGLLLLPFISNLLSFDYLLTISLVPVALYSVINSIFQQIYGVLLESKKIAIVSSVQIYLAFLLSVIAILCLPNKKYYGQVLGTVFSMLILGCYLVVQLKLYFHKSFKKTYIKYILSYSLPYIPYTLSGIILTQFGRIIISKSDGFSAAGLYSFAANIGMLMLILVSVTHQAWNPYYFKYMTNKNYKSINKDYDFIWRITLVAAIFLSLFGNEIGIVLGKRDFFSYLYIIPYFVLGYVFYQWAYVYMRNTGFVKKTIWNAIAILIAGSINILLSVVLINHFKELGVAIAFVMSYFFLLVISWCINKWILRAYVPCIVLFFRPFLYFMFFWICSVLLSLANCNYVILVLKFSLFFGGCCLLLKRYVYLIISYFNNKSIS